MGYEDELPFAEFLAAVADFLDVFLVVVDVAVEWGAAEVTHPVFLPERLDDVVIQVVLEQLHLQRIVLVVVDSKLSDLFHGDVGTLDSVGLLRDVVGWRVGPESPNLHSLYMINSGVYLG